MTNPSPAASMSGCRGRQPLHLHLKICRYSAMKPSGRPNVIHTVIRQFVMPQNRFALCGFYFVQRYSKSGAEICSPTPLCFGLQLCTSSFIILHRLVGLRLLRLCLKLRQGFALYPQWVSPLDPDQGRVPGPFARFARWVLLLCIGA